MTLSDITTDKTLFDIHSPTLVDDMSVVIPELATFTTEIPLIDICRYLILMYDIGSPMRDNVRMYYERKHKCAELLNFPTSKIGWETQVENMLIGRNQQFNALIASYIAQMGLPEYTQLIAYLEIQKIKYMEIFSGKMSDKSDQIIDRVTVAIVEITRKLFGSGQEDEITMARKFVWIVTKCEDGNTATVVWHSKTLEDARKIASGLDFGNFEGPVPVDMYPIGERIPVGAYNEAGVRLTALRA